ncbi:hypothetical protein KM043_008973 [Ampulex compressa]|nr:hypothetical protein KM043_008973 [Ampulex compressa]
MKGPKNLEDSIAPIAWLNRIFGLGIFEIPQGHPRVVFSIIYVATGIGVYLTLFSWAIFALEDDQASYEQFSVLFVLTVNVLVAFLSVLLAWCNTKNHKRIITKCSEADKVLQEFGVETSHAATFRRTVIIVCLFIICAVFICIIDVFWILSAYSVTRAVMINVLVHVPSLVNSVVDITFASHVWCLGNKIEKLNELIGKICLCTKTGFFVGRKSAQSATCRKMLTITGQDSRRDMIRHVVQTSREMHLSFVRIARGINRTYCLQVLLELAVQFTIITAALYNIYLAIMKPSVSRLPAQDRILRMCLWALLNTGKILFLNGICDKVSREIQQFSMQTILRPLNFSAFGFFNLNNEFTRTFFGTVTTYLVILIQMTPTNDDL